MIAALVAFSLVSLGPSRKAFSVVGRLQAHECPGGPVVTVIPPSDVVVATGLGYEGRFGRWRAVTWDDSDGPEPATHLVWVTEEELQDALGHSAPAADEPLTEAAFETCIPPEAASVLGTTVTRTGAQDEPDRESPVLETTAAALDTDVTAPGAQPSQTTTQATVRGAARSTVAAATSGSTRPPASPTTTVSVRTTMPNLLGFAAQDAQDLLSGLGLDVTVVEVDLPSDDSRDGLVVSQLPAAGSAVAAGTAVRIEVGHVADVAAPDVVETTPGPDSPPVDEGGGTGGGGGGGGSGDPIGQA